MLSSQLSSFSVKNWVIPCVSFGKVHQLDGILRVSRFWTYGLTDNHSISQINQRDVEYIMVCLEHLHSMTLKTSRRHKFIAVDPRQANPARAGPRRVFCADSFYDMLVVFV